MEVYYPCILLAIKDLSAHFLLDDIRKIIDKLGSNKAHKHGITSICMPEICGKPNFKPLKVILKSHLVSIKELFTNYNEMGSQRAC